MKKQIFTLLVGAAVLTATPAFAMLEGDSKDNTSINKVPTTKNSEESRNESLSIRLASLEKRHTVEGERYSFFRSKCYRYSLKDDYLYVDSLVCSQSSKEQIRESWDTMSQIVMEKEGIKRKLEKSTIQ